MLAAADERGPTVRTGGRTALYTAHSVHVRPSHLLTNRLGYGLAFVAAYTTGTVGGFEFE